MNNWDMVYGIIGSLGSLATAGAFFALFRKDKHKQDQIDMLTHIAKSLELKVNSDLQPIFDFDHYTKIYGEDNLVIKNVGGEMRIEEIVSLNKDIKISPLNLPMSLITGGKEFIKYEYYGNEKEFELEIIVIGTDIIGNKHKLYYHPLIGND